MQAWYEWFADQLNGNPAAQVLFMVLVVVGRFALDRWERQHQIRGRRRHRERHDA